MSAAFWLCALVSLVALISLVSCTDWDALSKDYEGEGVCPTYVVAGDTHTCVRKSSGSLRCFGDNRYGQLGTGDTRSHTEPFRVGLGDVAKIFLPTGNGDISADLAGFTCAITTGNALRCWGDSRYAGFASRERELSPVAVTAAGNLTTLAIGAGHVCTLDTDGVVTCFGANGSGQLGFEGPSVSVAEGRVIDGLAADKLVAGGTHTCARRTDGTMLCWGSNQYGQLGLGDNTARAKPAEVKVLAGRVARLATGSNHSCAQTAEGELWCFGDNRYGQLGVGDRQNRPSPVKLVGSDDASAKVFAGGGHSCAIRADGSFWCWGDNRSGQLGVGDKEPRLVPTKVDALSNDVVAAYAGGAHTCVLRANGAVWCFGNNQYGQLGVDVGRETTLPVEVLPACQ